MSPPPPVRVEQAQERISFYSFSLQKYRNPRESCRAPRRPSGRAGCAPVAARGPLATRLSVASWLFVGIKENLPVTRELPCLAAGSGRRDGGAGPSGAGAAPAGGRGPALPGLCPERWGRRLPGFYPAFARPLPGAAAMALRAGGRWARLGSALRGRSSGPRDNGDSPRHRDLREALRKVPGGTGERRDPGTPPPCGERTGRGHSRQDGFNK